MSKRGTNQHDIGRGPAAAEAVADAIKDEPKVLPAKRKAGKPPHAQRFKAAGGRSIHIFLTPSASAAVDALVAGYEFKGLSDATCAALVHYEQHGSMTEREQKLLERLSEEMQAKPGAVMGLAIRWLETCLQRGVRIEAQP
jgi:hypothetical protein